MSVINPITSRQIKKSSRAFKNLLSDFTLDGNILKPKNIDGWSFSNVKNRWIQDTKIPSHYETENHVIHIKNGEIRNPRGKYISIHSNAIPKWEAIGYRLSNGGFLSPAKRIIQLTSTIADSPADILQDARIVRITYLPSGASRMIFVNSIRQVKDAIFSFEYDYEESPYSDFRLDVYDTFPNIKFGPLFDGYNNCVIKIILEALSKNPRLSKKIYPLFDTYTDGVFAEDIENICDILNICIHVHASETHVFGKHNHHKNIIHIGINKSHAIKYTTVITKRTSQTVRYFGEADQIDSLFSGEKFESMLDLLKYIVDNSDSESECPVLYVNINRDCEIFGFKTNNHIYKYRSLCGFELDDTEFTVLDHAWNWMMTKFSRQPQTCKFEVIGLCDAMMFSEPIDGYHQILDLNGAYNHFPSYLPGDLKQIVNTTARLDVPYAFYLTRFMCPIEHKYCLRVISQEVLYVLEINDIRHVIYQAYVSSYITTIDVLDIIKDYPKRTWHKLIGKMQKCYSSKQTIVTNPEEAMRLGGVPIGNTDLFLCMGESENNFRRYYPHIAGCIIQYITAQLYKTVIENNLIVKRAWVDGIIADGIEHIVDNRYSIKTQLYSPQVPRNMQDSDFAKANDYIDLSFLKDSNIHAFIGPAGSGKSYQAKQILSNIPSSIMLTPTNLVGSMYDRSYTIHKWLDSHNGDVTKSSYELILIDEISMIPNEMFDRLTDGSSLQFILFGDNHQLPPVNAKSIDMSNLPITRLDQIYRQTDDQFIQDLNDVYEYGTQLDIPKIDIKSAIKQDARFVCCLNRNVDEINGIDYQLCTGEIITSNLKIGMHAIVSKRTYLKPLGIPNNEPCIISGKDKVLILGNEYDIKTKDCIPARAVTIHKLQGSTVDSMLVVDIRGISKFDCPNKMLYTAYSRVRSRDQLRNLIY